MCLPTTQHVVYPHVEWAVPPLHPSIAEHHHTLAGTHFAIPWWVGGLSWPRMNLGRCIVWLAHLPVWRQMYHVIGSLTCVMAGVELGDVWAWKDNHHTWQSVWHARHCTRNAVWRFTQSHQGDWRRLHFSLRYFNAVFLTLLLISVTDLFLRDCLQFACAVNLPVGCYRPHSLSPFIITASQWYICC